VEERPATGNASSAAFSSSSAEMDASGVFTSWQREHASREVIHAGIQAQVLSASRQTRVRVPLGPWRCCLGSSL
jgi:hypothetical protein